MLRQLSPQEMASIYDESREKIPPEERQKKLNQRLAKQLKFAYKNSPAVKDKFDKAGVSPSEIRTVKDLEKLPVTTKDDLVKLQRANPPFGGFLTVPIDSLPRIYVSPGPIYDFEGMERIEDKVRPFLRLGWPKSGDVVLVTLSYHMVPAALPWTDALDLIGCTVIPAGTGQTELQVKLLHDLGVTTIVGFPSFMIGILRKAEEMGYNVRKDFKLKYVFMMGERHMQLLGNTFKEEYGLKISTAGYGSADVGCMAYECGVGEGYHFHDEYCLTEVVDPDTGRQVGPHQVGQAVATLFSESYPLVRFGTGDLVSYTDEPCPCGRTAPRITGVLGMIGDHIRVKGMFVHLRELDEAMSKFPEVSKYQMVLRLEEQRDRITLKIEAPPGVNQNSLTEAINVRCQEVFKLKMDKIEFLPTGTLPKDYKKFVDTRWG